MGAAVDSCWGLECGTLPLQASVSPCIQQLLCAQSRDSEENHEAAGSAQDWDSPSSRMGSE